MIVNVAGDESISAELFPPPQATRANVAQATAIILLMIFPLKKISRNVRRIAPVDTTSSWASHNLSAY
jgi:hypothetical protein